MVRISSAVLAEMEMNSTSSLQAAVLPLAGCSTVLISDDTVHISQNTPRKSSTFSGVSAATSAPSAAPAVLTANTAATSRQSGGWPSISTRSYTDELFPNRPLCPDIIYERLKDGSYMVCNWKDRQSVRNMSAIDKDGAYETVYIGSRKGKTNGYLRIYDKRQEQIQSMGYRYDEALQHQSWVRFEASFLHDYAHQITSELLRSSTQDLQKLIAKYISDRYRFIDTSTGEVTAFTDDLIGIAAGVNPAALNTASPRDNTLRQSIEYLRAGSGLYATLFKTFKLWGDGADERLLKYLYDDYAYLYKAKLQMGRDKSKMREVRAWLQRHEAETKKHPLDDYLDRSEHKKYIPQYDAAGSPVVITMDGDDL